MACANIVYLSPRTGRELIYQNTRAPSEARREYTARVEKDHCAIVDQNQVRTQLYDEPSYARNDRFSGYRPINTDT